MKLSEIASALGLRCVRDAEIAALGFVNHRAEAMLTFAESPEFAAAACEGELIAALIVKDAGAAPAAPGLGLIVSDAPRRDFYRIHIHLAALGFYTGSQSAVSVAPGASIHPSAVIAERGVSIGEGCRIEANVVIQPGTVMGRDCTVRAGSVIGGEGFEFKNWDGNIVAIPHAGGVTLGDEVEIQQGCMIDRAVFGGSTQIGSQTKLDNLVHVAHNCRIGRRCLIAAGAVLSGSVTLEDDVWVGPRAVISNGLTIGARSRVSIGSAIMKDVPADTNAVGRGLGHLSQNLES